MCVGSGGDCDDDDPDVFPGQTKYFDQPRTGTSTPYDYNCDGVPTKERVINCGVVCSLGVEGFNSNAIACGATGSWGHCKSGVLPGALCTFEVIQANRPMGCR
jgi:hypothetical protein